MLQVITAPLSSVCVPLPSFAHCCAAPIPATIAKMKMMSKAIILSVDMMIPTSAIVFLYPAALDFFLAMIPVIKPINPKPSRLVTRLTIPSVLPGSSPTGCAAGASGGVAGAGCGVYCGCCGCVYVLFLYIILVTTSISLSRNYVN